MSKLLTIIVFGSLILNGCGKVADNISEKKSDDKHPEKQITESASAETTEIKLPTIQCGTCKKNITKALNKIDGRNEIDLSVDDKLVKVNFDGSKTNPAKIENAIVMAGYQANDKPADKEAYDNLDDCCKTNGHK